MTEEVQISAEVPAPELEATAAPETEVIQPEEKPAVSNANGKENSNNELPKRRSSKLLRQLLLNSLKALKPMRKHWPIRKPKN